MGAQEVISLVAQQGFEAAAELGIGTYSGFGLEDHPYLFWRDDADIDRTLARITFTEGPKLI